MKKKDNKINLVEFYMDCQIVKRYCRYNLWSEEFCDYDKIKYCEIFMSKYFRVLVQQHILSYFGPVILRTLQISPCFIKYLKTGFIKYIDFHFLLFFRHNFFLNSKFFIKDIELFVREYFQRYVKEKVKEDLLKYVVKSINELVPVSLRWGFANRLIFLYFNSVISTQASLYTPKNFSSVLLLNGLNGALLNTSFGWAFFFKGKYNYVIFQKFKSLFSDKNSPFFKYSAVNNEKHKDTNNISLLSCGYSWCFYVFEKPCYKPSSLNFPLEKKKKIETSDDARTLIDSAIEGLGDFYEKKNDISIPLGDDNFSGKKMQIEKDFPKDVQIFFAGLDDCFGKKANKNMIYTPRLQAEPFEQFNYSLKDYTVNDYMISHKIDVTGGGLRYNLLNLNNIFLPNKKNVYKFSESFDNLFSRCDKVYYNQFGIPKI